MSEAIVRFEGISKKYRRFKVRPFLLRNALLRLVGRAPKREVFWPLDDLHFELFVGETVGIVGLNGTGKSTLLKIIAGGCVQTAGTVGVRGRVAPVLSLGLGFQPDMTGRECIVHNARLLGFTAAEVDARMDEIVAFAELESFLETPSRFYSSGMLARLGFAVAMHTDPDLMLIDEVLAVGDHTFQEKCIGRIEQLRASGTTIVLVSHSIELVKRICTRVLWLDHGKIVRDGPATEVCDAYLRDGHG